MKPRYVEDIKSLMAAGCGHSGCKTDHLTAGIYLHSKCHPRAPTWAWFKDETITILCAECERKVGVFQIARRPVSVVKDASHE